MTRKHVSISVFATVAGALAVGSYILEKKAVVEAATAQAPRFEADPLWPKPLPNHWVIGTVIGGAGIDSKDNVWIVHRGRERSRPRKSTRRGNRRPRFCSPASRPARACFQSGRRSDRASGGPGQGFDWPASNHGIDIDHKGNVWIGGNRGGSACAAALPHDETRMGAGAVHDSFVR